VGYKEQIKTMASKYLALIPKQLLLKKAIVNEVEKGKPNMKFLEQKRIELRTVTMNSLKTKKEFLSVLQYIFS
jgi:hypothetical protein